MIRRLLSLFPIFRWASHYRKEDLSGDLSAGLTVGIMLIPQGMAYAMLAGLPPIYGLYASTIPLIAYAVFGSSRQLSVGPVAMDSLLVAIGVSKLAEYGSEQFIEMAILLALMVGVIQIALGTMRMGFMANFLSHPVISGFTSAAAIIIGLSQVPLLFGFTGIRGNQLPTLLAGLIENFAFNWIALLIGLVSVFILVIAKRVHRNVPGALIAVIFGILFITLGHFTSNEISIVGEVPKGLPSFQLPTMSSAVVLDLLPTALTIALVGFMEAYSVAKAMQAKHKNYRISANQELIAVGMSNFAGSFFQAFPVTGGFSRTAVNDQSGAKTGLSSLISAVLVVLTLVYFTGLFTSLPKAVLAAIILVAISKLIDFKEVIHLYRTNRRDLAMLMITFLATLFLGIQEGIGIGVGLSVIMVIYETSYPHYAVLGRLPSTDVYRNILRFQEAKEIDATLIIRFDAKLYFGNAALFESVIREELQKRTGIRLLILSAEAINTLDSTAAHMLHSLTDELRQSNIDIVFTAVKGPVRDVMVKCGIVEHLGKGHFFESISDALAHFDGVKLEEPATTRFQSNIS